MQPKHDDIIIIIIVRIDNKHIRKWNVQTHQQKNKQKDKL